MMVTQEMIDAGRAAYHLAARETGCIDFAGAKIEACYRAMRALEDDWIVVTVANSGFAKHVRRSAVASFGADLDGARYITLDGRAIVVKESEAELQMLLLVK